jgi:hypothetical protein
MKGVTKSPVASSMMPVKAGPPKPPRFPIAAIAPMPAAAALPVRKPVGSYQKIGMTASKPTAASVSDTSSTSSVWA